MNHLTELVNECEAAKDQELPNADDAKRTADELQSAGFHAAADKLRAVIDLKFKMFWIASNGFIEITPDKIKAFLKRKADAYDAQHKGKKKGREASPRTSSVLNYFVSGYTATATQGDAIWNQRYSDLDTISYAADTCHRGVNDAGTIGRYEWTETRAEKYEGIPPKDVVTKLRETKEKKLFDYFTIATVNDVHDPLLLGRIEGSASRYFVAQWGNDVTLDDII